MAGMTAQERVKYLAARARLVERIAHRSLGLAGAVVVAAVPVQPKTNAGVGCNECTENALKSLAGQLGGQP